MSQSRYQTVVKRHHVRRREIQVVAAALLTAMLFALGFYLGQRAAYSGMGIDPKRYREMQLAQPANEQQFELMESELDISGMRTEVNRVALEMVRQELAAQKEHILKLEESLRFYRSLMAPDDIAKGLTLRPIELIATAADNRFTYRIIVQQEARKHGLLKGSLSVKVLGVADGQRVSISLAELSESVESDTIALRFRYFQAVAGEIVLPNNFEPKAVSIVVRATSPKKVEVSEEFLWSVEERFSYVGQ
jgi:phosphotransferase system HPr-like phosphotransfer protein